MTYLPVRRSFNLDNPFREWDILQKEMNRIFDLSFPALQTTDSMLPNSWNGPSLDVYELKDSFIVKADLPGMEKENVDVTLENDLLTIKGEKRRNKELKEENCLRSECCYGRFSRTIKFSSPVNTEKVKAEFNNGVLQLMLPKKEEAKAKQIKINLSK